MTRILLALSLGFGGLILATEASQAGAQCAPRDAVVSTLARKYGETRRGIGLAANQAVMELFAAPATGSWTITVTLPDGTTCLLATGEGFEAVAETVVAPGDPA